DEETINEILLTDCFISSENNLNINLKGFIKENIKDFEWIIDPAKIQFPLFLRRHREGDEFYPVGLSGKKKISKFFR
ncbi:tRNA lysidine(34) synthetase TilS, partial [Arthrobacter sp. SIMBA_036]